MLRTNHLRRFGAIRFRFCTAILAPISTGTAHVAILGPLRLTSKRLASVRRRTYDLNSRSSLAFKTSALRTRGIIAPGGVPREGHAVGSIGSAVCVARAMQFIIRRRRKDF